MSVNSQSAAVLYQDQNLSLILVIAVISAAAAAGFVYAPLLVVAVLFVLPILAAPLRFGLFVYAQVFLLPLCPFVNLPGLPIRNISMLLHFLLFAGVWIRRRQRGLPLYGWILGSNVKKVILLFVAVAVASFFVSSAPRDAINSHSAIELLLSYVLTFFAVDGWLENRVQLARVLKVLFLSTIGVALFGFYQAITGGYSELYFALYPSKLDDYGIWEGRITSLLFHFNSLAGYLNLIIPFGIACMVLARDRVLRFPGLICVSLAAIAVLLTQSRGGILATFGVFAVTCWLLVPRVATRIKIFSVSILCGLLLFPLILTHFERLQGVDDATEFSRLALWQAAVGEFVGHPLLGVGYGNYKYFYSNFFFVPVENLDRLDAHNLYLQLLAETGLIGFLVFAVIVALFFRRSWNLIRDRDPLLRLTGVGVIGALAGTLIHGAVDFMFHVSPQFGALFWIIMGLCTSAATIKPAAE